MKSLGVVSQSSQNEGDLNWSINYQLFQDEANLATAAAVADPQKIRKAANAGDAI